MTTLSTPPLEDLSQRTVAAIRRASIAGPDERTAALREVARLLVEVRPLFTTRDGEPDWRGRTHDYREWTASMYARAGLDRGEAERLSSSVRYHVSPALRARLAPDEVDRLGLRPYTTREAAAQRREARAVEDRLVHGAGPLTPDETLEAVELAERLLRRAALGAGDAGRRERLLRVAEWLDDAATRPEE